MIKNTLFIIFLTLTITACQPKQLSTQTKTEEAPLDWLDAQHVIVEQLREKNFGGARESLLSMMAVADQDHDRWEYIRMVLVTLPEDLAIPMVTQALKKQWIRSNADELFGFSKVLTQHKKLENALTVITEAIDIERNEEYVFWRARLNLMLKNHLSAEQDYMWLLDQDNTNTTYVSQYASLLNHMGRKEAAQELLSEHENNPELLYKSIIWALQQEQDETAQSQYQTLKEIIDDTSLDDQKRLEIGELAYWLEDPEYSMAVLSDVKSGDKISQAKLIMGNVQLSLENYDRAIALYRQAQNGSADQAVLAYLFESQAHHELEEPRAGIRTLNQALQLFPDHSDLRYSRAMMYEAVNDLSAMEKDLMHIIQNDTAHHDALNALGYSWADRNIKLDQALTYIQKAHEMQPANVPILDSLGWVYYRLGDLDQARLYLEMATEEEQSDMLLYEHLLEVLEAIGDQDAIDKISTIINSKK